MEEGGVGGYKGRFKMCGEESLTTKHFCLSIPIYVARDNPFLHKAKLEYQSLKFKLKLNQSIKLAK